MDIRPQPFKLTTGSDAETRLKRHCRNNVKALKQGLARLHGMDGIIRWRKIYEAKPAQETREWPWHNASNLVVPICAIHSDTLQARVMSATLKTRPLWIARTLGDAATDDSGITMRAALEEFLQYVGLEPDELDLYRVYHEFFGEAIRYGTSVVKSPWLKITEDSMMPAGDMSGKYDLHLRTVYEGPRPEKLPFEDFLIGPSYPTIEAAPFKVHVVHLQRDQLLERRYTGVYDKVAVDAVLTSGSDRQSPGIVQSQKEMDARAVTAPYSGTWEEWDINECHFKYRTNENKFVRLIVWYHDKSNQILRAYYHYYPDEIFTAARLFYRDDMFHGMGFAEILAPFQEEISEIHNQRRDNMTVANLKCFRVDPESKLHKGYRIFPSAMVPARKDEAEPWEFGTPVQGEIDSERLSLELAEKRSGVSPPMQGAGAGSNTKRGVYTAMGTLSLLQEGNTRTDLNITDIRYAHTRIGRLLCKEYADFGIGDRKELFGKKGAIIEQALAALRSGKMALPIYASTASVNREVEKQNDLMLSGVMEKYHGLMTNLIAQANNPMTPEPVRDYLTKAIKSMNMLTQSVLQHFDFDEVERLAPEPAAPKPIAQPGLGSLPGGGAPGPQPGAADQGAPPPVGILPGVVQ